MEHETLYDSTSAEREERERLLSILCPSNRSIETNHEYTIFNDMLVDRPDLWFDKTHMGSRNYRIGVNLHRGSDHQS